VDGLDGLLDGGLLDGLGVVERDPAAKRQRAVDPGRAGRGVEHVGVVDEQVGAVELGLGRGVLGHHVDRADRRARGAHGGVDALLGQTDLEVATDLVGLVVDHAVEIDAVDDVQTALEIQAELHLAGEDPRVPVREIGHPDRRQEREARDDYQQDQEE
jgi:hypothetical protein